MPQLSEFDKIIAILVNSGPVLRASAPKDIAQALAIVAKRLFDPNDPIGASLRARLPASTGLSPQMVNFGLEQSLGLSSQSELSRLQERLTETPRNDMVRKAAGLSVVVLASNLFVGSWRAILEPLLQGSPTLVKAPSSDAVFAQHINECLDEVAPELGQGLAVLDWPREQFSFDAKALEHVEVLSVFGSDQTIQSISQTLPPQTRLLAHGHGIGAAYIDASSLCDESSAHRLAMDVALDLTAYDQRGCMSPYSLWIQDGAYLSAKHFGELLAEEALPKVNQHLPKGSLPKAVRIAEQQWRAVAAARSHLFENEAGAVAIEPDHRLRLSPGYRNLSVHDCKDIKVVINALIPLGTHLKTLGVATESESLKSIAQHLPAPLCPRICKIGLMQKPPLDYIADGLPLAGNFSHWIDCS
ncbi:MAG: hypothetical protein IPJ88_01320 [Myxococcales bacterium]|nr:MAG: hypothetical protein IPJ88_01320 [Myxococcales bacterium]